jgi:hypothetical protein
MQSLCWTSDRAAIGRGSAPPPQHHPPVVPALAYRFDGPDRSIVVSGDTDTSGTLVQLARGADGLVHEAMSLPTVDRPVRPHFAGEIVVARDRLEI